MEKYIYSFECMPYLDLAHLTSILGKAISPYSVDDKSLVKVTEMRLLSYAAKTSWVNSTQGG